MSSVASADLKFETLTDCSIYSGTRGCGYQGGHVDELFCRGAASAKRSASPKTGVTRPLLSYKL
jgi:hypothetical protein